ncbi:MAG: SDR family NAD(P)-dependent oxidoreductase [Acidimicrobiia bacterium]
MRVRDKIVVVTGAGNGIGRGMAERFVTEGAKTVVFSDLNMGLAESVATPLKQPAMQCDVSDAGALRSMIDTVENDIGPIDLMVSNAAYGFTGGFTIDGIEEASGFETSEEAWDASWQINVMAHIRAARQLVPRMMKRGGGYFLNTVSAAGLITSNSKLAYTVTKHADIGFAEWLALNYGTRGIGVSCLCPTAVATRPGQFDAMPEIGLVQTPAEIAQFVIDGLERETFLILPNPAVGGSFRKKATDYDAWIARTQQRLTAMDGLRD